MPSPRTPSRARLPVALIALVFLPLGAGYFALLRDVEGFRFAHPFALALIPPAVALVAWAGLVRAPGRRGLFVYSRAADLGAERPGLVARLRDLPTVLRLAAVVLLGVALARPESTQVTDDLELEGIDIVIALDLSGSMQETDLAPNRLEAAKMVIQDFVKRRPSDRIGLVIFGREAFTDIPLTLDHGTFLRMLAELHVGIVDGRATAIGNGIGVALNRLRKSEAKSKVIIVLTDGENNAGNISPEQAARYAQTLGVKIYTVLAGTSDGEAAAPGRQRQPVNPKLLEEIASMTGGTPYLATDTRALARAVSEDHRGPAEIAHPRPRHALPGALPPLPAGGVRAPLARDGAAAHPLPTDPLTMRFANPHALWLLLAVPAAVIAYGLGFASRRRRLARLGDEALIALMASTVSVPRKVARAALVVTALGLLALALARPQAGGRARVAQQRGLDLVVALDFSRSMLAKDVYPSRLERAKRELGQLLDGLGGDRVGVVAFAGESLTYPPTTDYSAVKLFWRDLGPWDMPVGGTAIGRAIKSALEQLTALRVKGGATRGQAILLLTDGEDNESEPLDAAEEASKLGVKIFTVGIGSRSGSSSPSTTSRGR